MLLYVNPPTSASSAPLDLGESSKAPLQAGETLTVKLWWALSSWHANTCGVAPIETLVGRLLYNSSELVATGASNAWTPHSGGSYQGTLQVVPVPNDAPEDEGEFDKWSVFVWAGVEGPGFSGLVWTGSKETGSFGKVVLNLKQRNGEIKVC